MSTARKVCAVAALVALAWAVAPVAEAQAPIRIGASVSLTATYAALGQNLHRGYRRMPVSRWPAAPLAVAWRHATVRATP